VNTSLPSTVIDPTETPFGLHSVCRTLRDANATLQRFAWLGDQLAVAEWTRETEEAETVYDNPGHHTLSCYIDGGCLGTTNRAGGCAAKCISCTCTFCPSTSHSARCASWTGSRAK
jgi:hypothetical protein